MLTRRPIPAWLACALPLAPPAIVHGHPARIVSDVVLPEPGGNGTNIATFVLRLADTTRTRSLSQSVPVGHHMESVRLSNGATTQALVYSARFTVQVAGTPTQRPITFDYTTAPPKTGRRPGRHRA